MCDLKPKLENLHMDKQLRSDESQLPRTSVSNEVESPLMMSHTNPTQTLVSPATYNRPTTFPLMKIPFDCRLFIYRSLLAARFDHKPPHLLQVLGEQRRRSEEAEYEYQQALTLFKRINISVAAPEDDHGCSISAQKFNNLNRKNLSDIRHLSINVCAGYPSFFLCGHVSTCLNWFETITVHVKVESRVIRCAIAEKIPAISWIIHASVVGVSKLTIVVEYESRDHLRKMVAHGDLRDYDMPFSTILGVKCKKLRNRKRAILTWSRG